MLVLLWMLDVGCWSFRAVAASNPGDEVIVVYNTRIPESRAIADYYTERRQVPTNQVFGFSLPTGEDMSRAEFRDSLQKPLAQGLEERKLWHVASEIVPAATNRPARMDWRVVRSKIRYAALCYGVPLRISPDPNLKEEGTENLRPEMKRNEAAVDSELVLLPLLEQNLPLAGPLRNPAYAATNVASLHPTNGVLLVARLDGPTPAIARGLVDKAIQAEMDGLWGRGYFDIRKTTDPALKLGDDMIRSASEICRRLGFETVVDENPGTFPAGFPMSHIAVYVGWYNETVCGPFAQPTVEFMPGAFAYHLHSYSANTLRSINRFWAGPLLAKGATATMGCVDEPYLTGTPDMAIFIARFILQGFSLGEAACACQGVVSWQTTVVGDPLYRPFGRNLDELSKELDARVDKRVEWCYLRLLDLNLANGRSVTELATLMEGWKVTRQSAVLTEKLGDLYCALGKPSSAAYEWARALKLDASPQQKIRLRLTLGERLVVLERDAEAYEYYQNLLQECPNYPDKTSIYRRLLALARKLGKKDDAEKFTKAVGE